jgi:hypothetical protein
VPAAFYPQEDSWTNQTTYVAVQFIGYGHLIYLDKNVTVEQVMSNMKTVKQELWITGFRPSWIIIDVNSVPGCLYSVDVGSVFDVSSVNALSIFRVDPEDGATMYFRNVDNTTLKVEAVYTSGTSVTLRMFARYRICEQIECQ